MKKVFVYGTLKSGGKVRGLDQFPGASIVGKATTTYPDYDMVDLGSFPAVLLKGEKYIQGEVWEVNDQTMLELDMIEGYPDFYNKQMVDTSQGRALMYFMRSAPGYATGTESPNIDEDNNTLSWRN